MTKRGKRRTEREEIAQSQPQPLFFTDSEDPESYSLRNQFAENMEFRLVRDRETVTHEDAYKALALSIRDRMIRDWIRTQREYDKRDVKKVYYLSLEFLMGRLLGNALINMNFRDECKAIMKSLGYDLDEIREIEHDMGLGNGGLGRLAACFLDSMATLELPAFGYGIRYEFGIFKQEIEHGYQVEYPDNWLRYGSPWEVLREDLTYRIKFGGRVISYTDDRGRLRFSWVDTEDVLAVAYDVPVPGYGTSTVNSLRLWQAAATQDFDFRAFDAGDYLGAVEKKAETETISKVLYPNDNTVAGKVLRLKQQYFFVSASLHDIIASYKKLHKTFSAFPNKVAIQLNDTHPAIAIPELMRILLDEEGLSWDEAWYITTNTFAYTNHTVLSEALERWSVKLFEELLPRHLQIIYEINHRFLEMVRMFYDDNDPIIARVSIIQEGEAKYIRMAHLAIIGSHSVNGVAELHTKILCNELFRDFYRLYPHKFNNKTNGITQRRWLKLANPLLSELICSRIGDGWVKDLMELRRLEEFADDPAFLDEWRIAKTIAKQNLIEYIYIQNDYETRINPTSLFDSHIKRMHEYKRQLLNVLHCIWFYTRIKDNPSGDFVPRTVFFSGKAAPGYYMAKLIIKLINAVAAVVNCDPDIGNRLKIFFLKNYSVSLAERIIPATDVSQQISTAGFEASGTGNMKFQLNGAITIGTMDGANVEIREEVGDENIIIFGLLAEEVAALRSSYNPWEYYTNNQDLRRVLDMIRDNYFSRHEPGIFQPIIDSLLHGGDRYFVCADFASYIQAQERVNEIWRQRDVWTRMSIINTARSGKFSSDRTIREYANDIWKVKPVPIRL
ncbi:MAG: glycogen/starch/alpha-glucan phosphorylase [Bacteroidota bacterium]|nr:glycogen/starch/alpha-glucan phosphorylase [Candidatus Kapabacteria bacterium]MDW8219190.1 glycogen/starch/alpha-glucan phosphorylase [Bacteroidota bacterium]